MSIGLLAMVLDEAVRRPDLHLSANVARDKKLKVKVPKKAARDWLEPEEVLCLLEAAELSGQAGPPRNRSPGRRSPPTARH